MNFIKTLNGLLTRTLIVLCCLALSVTSFAQTPNITASIEEVSMSETNIQDASGNFLLDYAAHLDIDIELPQVGPGQTIGQLSDIVGVSFEIEVDHFVDMFVDGEDLLFCNGATGYNITTLAPGRIEVQTFFDNGMTPPSNNCYQPNPAKGVVALVIDSTPKDDLYFSSFGECFNNVRTFTETLSITNAYYMLEDNNGVGTLALNDDDTFTFMEDYTVPCYSDFSFADFSRSWTHVCTSNDGSFIIEWTNNPIYNNVYINVNGRGFIKPINNYYTSDNLATGNYDIKIKLSKNGYVYTLDDINIIDLSLDATRSWGHPTCGNNNGWLEITWVKKALNYIKISTDGGTSYETVPAANEYYRLEDLGAEDYDIWLKWSYAPFACPTQLDDINLRDQWNFCKTSENFAESLIDIYPNPANEKVYIDLDGLAFEEGNLKIYDLAGKKIYTNLIVTNQQRLMLNVEHLNSGIYLISFTDNSNGEAHTDRLTISR